MASVTNSALRAISNPADSLALFVDLSYALSGFTRVELWGTGMVQTYYNELNLIIGERESGKLLGVSRGIIPPGEEVTPAIMKQVEREILADGRYGPVARNIIRLWYLGAWAQLPRSWRNIFGATSFDTDHIVSAEAYQESLVWTAGETHPMGAKQQGFGTWAMPGPDNDGGLK
jgi:hypothetical protein